MNYLALLGWNDGTKEEYFTMEQLFNKFSIDRITKSVAIFDFVKLRWMNGKHLRALLADKLTNKLGEHWKNIGILFEFEGPFVNEVAELLKDGIHLVSYLDQALEKKISYHYNLLYQVPKERPF